MISSIIQYYNTHTEPEERKSAKLELIETQDEKPHPPTEQSQDHMISREPPGYYPPQSHEDHMTSRHPLESVDSFDENDYYRQVKKPPPMVRQESKRSKLVRFGSVVRRFDKLEEMFNQPQEMEYESDEVYDEVYDEDDPANYTEGEYTDDYEGDGYDPANYEYEDDPANYQEYESTYSTTQHYQAEGSHFNSNGHAQTGNYTEHAQNYEPQYNTLENTQQSYEGQHHTNQYTGSHFEPTEHAQKPSKPLGYRGSIKKQKEHLIGGVVPSSSFKKPLDKQEYKIDIQARVKALESRPNSQKSLEIPKQGHLPFELSLPNYEAIQATHAAKIGQPLYTHPGGYKFRIDLWASGKGSGSNTYISVSLHSLEGEFNGGLTFPVRFHITLELVNQYADYDHHSREIECYYRDGGYNNEIGCDLHYISKDGIYWDPQNRTQFLLNDVLRFRVTRITMV